MKTEDLKNNQEYKYGFTTDVENIRSPKGLNEDTIKFISNIKKEPKWMLDWRLKAFNRLKVLKELLTYFTLCTWSFQLGLCQNAFFYTGISSRGRLSISGTLF